MNPSLAVTTTVVSLCLGMHVDLFFQENTEGTKMVAYLLDAQTINAKVGFSAIPLPSAGEPSSHLSRIGFFGCFLGVGRPMEERLRFSVSALGMGYLCRGVLPAQVSS